MYKQIILFGRVINIHLEIFKKPKSALLNLTGKDIVVLDLALSYMKDVHHKNGALGSEENLAACNKLHDKVLEIRRGY